MLMVANSTVAKILNNFLLPVTEEDPVCTSRRTISACAMYYSECDQGVSAFIKVLTKGSLTRS